MNVSIIIPVDDTSNLDATLQGVLAQRYDEGDIEVIVVGYGNEPDRLALPTSSGIQVRTVDHSSPYVARNLGADCARGELLLFTEAAVVAEPDWIAAHVAHVRAGATVTVGHVAPAKETHLLELFASYERVRDAWVFSGDSWRHYFGRPKNMAIIHHRFDSHGPFEEVARGADSMFVQKVASEISCDEVVLAADAVVHQLSIRGLATCYRDRFGHSHGLKKYQSSHAAPISLARRIQIYRDTLDRRDSGPLDAIMLLLLLTAGIWVFRLGGWFGSVAPSDQA